MRKNYLLILLLCLLYSGSSMAQSVIPTQFQSVTGTYTEITDGTAITIGYEGTALTNKAFISNTEGVATTTTTVGFPIGFDFLFNSTMMNRFVISCYPQLILGKDNVTINPARSGFLLTDANGEGIGNVVGVAVYTDLTVTDDLDIRYKLTGTAPNRVLTVQWKNLSMSTDWGTNFKKVDAQVRLYETSNKVEIIFNNWASEGTSSKYVRVGVRGIDQKDAHLRYSSDNDFTQTVMSISSQMGWRNTSIIPDGLTYTFTPPADCDTPTAQPTALELTASSIGINGTFTATETADHYLVLMSTSATLTQLPQNDVYYTKNETLGNATIIDYTTEASFATPQTLSGATPYYFHIFATNSYCSFGPKYNTTTPLTGNTTTLPEVPASLLITDVGYTTAKLSVQGNTASNDVIILATDVPLYSQYGDLTENGEFAVPSGALNVGDELQITDDEGTRFGGKVVYVGPSSENIEVTGLSEGWIWHFIAYSKDGVKYSSTAVNANVMTWATVPYNPNYWDFPHYNEPFGWTVETSGGFATAFYMAKVRSGTDTYVQLTAKAGTASPVTPSTNSVMTQYILLSENSNRLVLNCTFWEYISRFQSDPYNTWNENDYFDIEATKDGTNFTLIKRFNHENPPQFATLKEMKDLYIPIGEELNGEKVMIRFNWKAHANVTFESNYLRIEEKSECDYPVDVAIVPYSAIGANATIKWTPLGDEEFWDIQYREVGVEEWTLVENISTNPYRLTGLPLESSIEVNVRARCSETTISPWSPKSCIFETGFELPYSQDFADSTQPKGWTFGRGDLGDPSSITPAAANAVMWSFYDEILSAQFYSNKDWIFLPVFDFGDGTYNYKLEFDLRIELPTDEMTDVLYVLMSKDGGATFNTTDVIDPIDMNDATVNDGEFHKMSYVLSGATGANQIAFHLGSTNGRTEVFIDNVSITETCPPLATNGVAQDITEDSAKVTWEGESDEWQVFVRKAGVTDRDYQPQTENEIILTELDPATTYEVGISNLCEGDDLAKVLIVRFTTVPLDPCDPIETVNVTTTINSATLSWTHTGISFDMKYRRVGVETWTETTLTQPTITISNLTEDTEYEYTIQAVCSEADGHVSEWTDVATFSTLPITCFPPTNIQIVPAHRTAVVTWEGAAANYELNYRVGTEGEWTVKEVSAKTATLEELTPLTDYSLRIRSKCSDTEISLWSSIQTFKTLQIPDCVIPTNLAVNDVTDNTAMFTWQEGDALNLTWNLRYRPGSATSWTTVENLAAKSYEVEGLVKNTLYIWTVRANCEENQSSWAAQNEFTTTNVSIPGIGKDDLQVFASGKIINIINPENLLIDKITITALNGMVLNVYEANSTDNIMLPVSLDNAGVYIIQVESNGFKKNYKVLIK